MIDIPHIPKGHELVKRYWNYNPDGLDEDREGEWVRIEDVKKHLVEWLKEELAKVENSNDREYVGSAFTLRATIHHVEVIL
jgi:hypothetical protein